MRASGGRSITGTRRSTGINSKKLREPTTQHQQTTSDGFANCPRRHGGSAQCLNGTFSRTKHQHQQRQCKMKIGTWNVTSLTGKEFELIEEAKKYQLDILGISSTKRKGQGTLALNNGWQLFYSGVDQSTHAQAGVAILLNPLLADAVLEWKPINERVALIRLQLKATTLTIIQVYAPNIEADYMAFLDTVLTAMESVPMKDFILFLGDFNAHVGNDSQTWNGVIGLNGDQDLNNQGRCLLDFCATSGLSIMNTFFQHKNIHKYTWYKTGGSMAQRSLIDFVIVSQNLRRAVTDVRVKRGAELSTDHHLVVCILEISSNHPIRKTKSKKITRIRWEALADEEARRKFAKEVNQRYSQLPSKETDIELEWFLFRTALMEAAAEACGTKQIGFQHGQKKTAWWNEQVRKAISEKKTAYRQWIQRQTPENWQNY
ncbi:unnamed protein product [Rotaria sp. Silwood1]|nr:unnamed protein product [Rotaria sp. Silwood1]